MLMAKKYRQVEITQRSATGEMQKQNVIHPYKGLLFSTMKTQVLMYKTTWMNPKNILLSERNQAQDYTV